LTFILSSCKIKKGGFMKSVYLHIPFCKTICSYCDFCKQFYEEAKVDAYLEALEHEIQAVYQGELLQTLYIGGGTPSVLNMRQLERLASMLSSFHIAPTCEITFEMNIESMTREKLLFLKAMGVNRLSIGIETFHRNLHQVLNRSTDYETLQRFLEDARKIGFQNINGDLIYAVTTETLEDVRKDVGLLLSLNLEHISTYSLMIEPHTKLYIEKQIPISEELDEQMYRSICQILEKEGYQHYEISNFAKSGYESKHNLVYWNNEAYYGFGLGASGYVKDVRYENTWSMKEYLQGNYRKKEEFLSKNDKMCYEMILGLRKKGGVSGSCFLQKYGVSIEEVFAIEPLLRKKYLIWEKEFLKMNEKYIYVSNEILEHFILESR